MNQSDLVEKLDAMRSAAGIREIDVMTRLFGVTFDREIAACETNANRIVDEYLRVHGHRVGRCCAVRKLTRNAPYPQTR